MTRLDYDSWYDTIEYCICCGWKDIIKVSVDNWTMVLCECNECCSVYTINLYDNSLDNE